MANPNPTTRTPFTQVCDVHGAMPDRNRAYYDAAFTVGSSYQQTVALDLWDFTLVAVIANGNVASGTGWTSAVITFLGSADGVKYGQVNDVITAGVTTTPTLAGGEYVLVNPLVFYGLRYIIFQSGTVASPVAQSGATIVVRAIVRSI